MKTNTRNEIKSRIVREGFTMEELLERLHDDYGWSRSVSNLSAKLQRDSIRYGDGNEVLKEYYGVHVTYTKPVEPDIILSLNPVLELEGGSEASEPSERRTVDGVTVNLSLDHYKVVPENYEQTEDDLARKAAGHYYISWGSDEIMEYDMAFADFVMDGVNYTLMDMFASKSSFDTLTQMAKEILDTAKE